MMLPGDGTILSLLRFACKHLHPVHKESEKGQSTVEYLLLIVVIVIFTKLIVGQLTYVVNEGSHGLGFTLEMVLGTGFDFIFRE